MSRRPYAKASQRFVMYIPNALREEIEDWVGKMGMTLAEFGREAFESYLNSKRREERNAQLVETCRLFENKSKRILKEWASTEIENWPA